MAKKKRKKLKNDVAAPILIREVPPNSGIDLRIYNQATEWKHQSKPSDDVLINLITKYQNLVEELMSKIDKINETKSAPLSTGSKVLISMCTFCICASIIYSAIYLKS